MRTIKDSSTIERKLPFLQEVTGNNGSGNDVIRVSRDDDDPYWITISDKFGLNLTLLCNICKEDQMKLFLFLITLNAYWCPRVPLSRPPQISLWKSQQSVASYTLTRTYITYKNNISARSLATFFNWVIHLRKK